VGVRVMGVDPGSYRMGYGVAEEGDTLTAIAWGAIKPKEARPVEERLEHIYSELTQLLDRWQPQEVAVEDPFVGANHRSILALGQAQGVVLLAAAQRKLPVSRYSPAQVKRAVADYGVATKDRLEELVRIALRLDTLIEPNDAADALAVALCHFYQRRLSQVLARQASPGA